MVDEQTSGPLFGGALTPWVADGEWRHTQMELGPVSTADGNRPLTGVLFAWVDVVAGSPPSGAINPTVDLQVRLFRPPQLGTLHFKARTLRLGRSLYVGEVELHQDRTEGALGVAVATFVNRPIPAIPPPERAGGSGLRSPRSYGPLTGIERLSRGVIGLGDSLDHPFGMTSGATLGRLIEEAALDQTGPGTVVDEIDVRFLRRAKVSPIRARSVVLGRRDATTTVRVEVTDGAGELATYGLVVCRQADTVP